MRLKDYLNMFGIDFQRGFQRAINDLSVAGLVPTATSPLTSVHQGTGPFLLKPENPRRRTKPEKVRRF